MLNRLKLMDIFQKLVNCRFTLAEELYRIPCLLNLNTIARIWIRSFLKYSFHHLSLFHFILFWLMVCKVFMETEEEYLLWQSLQWYIWWGLFFLFLLPRQSKLPILNLGITIASKRYWYLEKYAGQQKWPSLLNGKGLYIFARGKQGFWKKHLFML